MYSALALASFTLLAAVRGQQIGTAEPEVHPGMAMQTCTTGGVCTTKNTKVVLDANWRWLHDKAGYTNCYTGQTWNKALCPDGVTCANNCALEGAKYAETYGITTSGSNSLTLKFVTKSAGTNVGSRVYLMADDDTYQTFALKNNEFTFDVDMSNLPCGINGALYFSQMDADGGKAKNPGNKAGARYGTGYCDAQCPHDMKFINGEANVLDWDPSDNDPNAGSGRYGTCCTEMDIWEANSNAAAYTPHTCKGNGLTRCSGLDCGDGSNRYAGICDKDGCDFNSYRMGDTSFLGPGKKVDTTKKITVVTQFITADNTASGLLKSIRRFYVQNGVVLANSVSNIAGVDATNEISDNFCKQQKSVFGDLDYFSQTGGMTGFSKALDTPMVLSMSIWDDHTADMKWLDSTYPVGSTKPGAVRGPCNAEVGKPENVERDHPNSSVTFSNIKFGPIGSTFNSGAVVPPVNPPASSVKPTTVATSVKPTTIVTSVKPTSTTSSIKPPTTTPPTTGPLAPKYGQCGGQGWTGPTACVAGSTCTVNNQWYSQCL